MPAMSTFFPSSSGMSNDSSQIVAVSIVRHLGTVLPLHRITPHHPSIHAIRQVMDIFQAGYQGNFRGGCAALPTGTYEDHLFIGGDVQFFKRLAERVDTVDGYQRGLGYMPAMPLVRLPHINDARACLDHLLCFVRANGFVWKRLFFVISGHCRSPFLSALRRIVPAR